MTDVAPAWLLSLSSNIQMSIAEHEAVEYLENPALHYVPMSPAYCKNIIFWQNRIVPLIDLNILYDYPATTHYQCVIVTAYQQKEHTPLDYTAFALASPPEKIMVKDDDACALPEDYPGSISPCVLAMFKHNNQAISIIDIARLSSGNL